MLTFERGKTSKDRLEMRWDYPAPLELQPQDDGASTVAAVRMTRLPRDDAFARLAGDDERPMLIVRECEMCQGTDDAVLSRTLDNERTLLLARWFHCVKLKYNVLKKDHTFAAVFEGDHPPHLVLCSPDGSNAIPLPGDQSQSELWHAMEELLARHYDGDVEATVKELFRVLTDYDRLDGMEDQLEEQIDHELEKHGPQSSKLRHLKQKLAEIEAEKAEVQAREEKTTLHLRTTAE